MIVSSSSIVVLSYYKPKLQNLFQSFVCKVLLIMYQHRDIRYIKVYITYIKENNHTWHQK